MIIWLVFVLMTAAAALVLLVPLVRIPSVRQETDGEIAFYRTQLAEIDRDSAMGLLPFAEVEAARTEAGRRLLRVLPTTPDTGSEHEGESGLRRRRAASALVISMVPLLSIAIYGALGSPHLPDRPLASRALTDPANLDMQSAIDRIESNLVKHPEDGRGWEILASTYMQLRRYEDAARAYANAERLLGETPGRLIEHAEAKILANGGIVSAEARAGLTKAQSFQAAPGTIEPVLTAKLSYYLAVALEQDGNMAGAQNAYKEILARTPPDAAWRQFVENRLARLSTQSPPRGSDGSNAPAGVPVP